MACCPLLLDVCNYVEQPSERKKRKKEKYIRLLYWRPESSIPMNFSSCKIHSFIYGRGWVDPMTEKLEWLTPTPYRNLKPFCNSCFYD